MVTETSRLKVPAHVHAREFDGELIIVDLERGDYFGLDEVGSRMWQGLASGRSPAEVVDGLLAEYDVEKSRLSVDVLHLVKDLLARGLLVECP